MIYLPLDTREKNEAFGSSLLLANSPMSPKIVNGSFAAIFDTDEFLAKAFAGIRATVSQYIFLILGIYDQILKGGMVKHFQKICLEIFAKCS